MGYILVGRNDGVEDRLKVLTKDMRIESHIKFMGARNDVAKILSATDIAVLSSQEEGFSNALLEYTVAGLPIVATDVGGNAEAVTEREGLIVPKGDIEAIADAIVKLASDKFLRKKIGLSGQKRVLEKVSVDLMIDHHCRIYGGLLK